MQKTIICMAILDQAVISSHSVVVVVAVVADVVVVAVVHVLSSIE